MRQGSRHVTLYARRQRIAASQRELDYAAVDGIEIQQGMAITEFTEKGPLLTPRIYDEQGNLIREEEPVLMPADSTIIAISQGPKDKIVNTTHDLTVDKNGLIVVDENGRTTREGVFSSGDVVIGAKNVVLAVKYSKIVAKAMDEYLTAKRNAQ